MQKISKQKIAASYAKAWLDAAKDAHKEDAVFAEIEVLSSAYKENPLLWKTLSAPINNHQEIVNTTKEIAKSAGLSELSQQTLALVAENNRLDLLNLILKEYVRLYYEDKNIMEVYVDTAVKLTEQQDTKLKKVLTKKLKQDIIIHYTIKPEVLGGLAVRYGSFLFDDTLKGKLNRIEVELRGDNQN